MYTSSFRSEEKEVYGTRCCRSNQRDGQRNRGKDVHARREDAADGAGDGREEAEAGTGAGKQNAGNVRQLHDPNDGNVWEHDADPSTSPLRSTAAFSPSITIIYPPLAVTATISLWIPATVHVSCAPAFPLPTTK